MLQNPQLVKGEKYISLSICNDSTHAKTQRVTYYRMYNMY